MGHFTEDRDDPLGLLLPLDGDAGPSRRISRKKAFELVRAALQAFSVVQPVTQSSIRGQAPRGTRLPRRSRPRRSHH